MALQACGMIIVQYNPCKGKALYSPLAYLCMGISTLLTAVSAVRNEYLVKNYAIGLNVQNCVLYSGGVILNLAAYMLIPNPNSSQRDIGFFDGYDNFLAVGVVIANAMIGLAITAVYKYADAVVKCFASDITAVLLIIISTFFFALKATITMWCGVFVVAFAVHLYIDATAAASKAMKAAAAAAAEENSKFFEGKDKDDVVDTRGMQEITAVAPATMGRTASALDDEDEAEEATPNEHRDL
jgi:hypothetical protein